MTMRDYVIEQCKEQTLNLQRKALVRRDKESMEELLEHWEWLCEQQIEEDEMETGIHRADYRRYATANGQWITYGLELEFDDEEDE